MTRNTPRPKIDPDRRRPYWGDTTIALSYTQLGDIMLTTYGDGDCLAAYGTTIPHEVGFLALSYTDINPDGTFRPSLATPNEKDPK